MTLVKSQKSGCWARGTGAPRRQTQAERTRVLPAGVGREPPERRGPLLCLFAHVPPTLEGSPPPKPQLNPCSSLQAQQGLESQAGGPGRTLTAPAGPPSSGSVSPTCPHLPPPAPTAFLSSSLQSPSLHLCSPSLPLSLPPLSVSVVPLHLHTCSSASVPLFVCPSLCPSVSGPPSPLLT